MLKIADTQSRQVIFLFIIIKDFIHMMINFFINSRLTYDRGTLLNLIYSTLMIKIDNLRKAGGCDNIFSAIEIARLDMVFNQRN